jgi:hypothetical protein
VRPSEIILRLLNLGTESFISTLKVRWSYLDTSIPFGKIGTVTGVYKYSIEILFDEPFIGASSLSGRCPFFRGGEVDILHIFNLTRNRGDLNLKRDISALLEQSSSSSIVEWNGKLDIDLHMDQILESRLQYLGDDFGTYADEHRNIKSKFKRRKQSDQFKFDKNSRKRKGGNPKKRGGKEKEKEEYNDDEGIFGDKLDLNNAEDEN